MSKMINALNQIWYQKDGEIYKMGLTRTFLDTLDECLHILPATAANIKEKSPLFTVETNDSLVSVLSPVTGSFLDWNARATNFPDKLTDEDVILTLSTKPAIVKAQPAEAVGDEAWLRREIDRLTRVSQNAAMGMTTRLGAQQQAARLTTDLTRMLLRPAENLLRSRPFDLAAGDRLVGRQVAPTPPARWDMGGTSPAAPRVNWSNVLSTVDTPLQMIVDEEPF